MDDDDLLRAFVVIVGLKKNVVAKCVVVVFFSEVQCHQSFWMLRNICIQRRGQFIFTLHF